MHTNGGLANRWEWVLALASSGALKPDETLETSSSGPPAARLWLAGRAVLDAARRRQPSSSEGGARGQRPAAVVSVQAQQQWSASKQP